MKSEKSETLLKKAEKALQDKIIDLQELPTQDVQNLVHELQVYQYQIELEMQNEELRRMQIEMDV